MGLVFLGLGLAEDRFLEIRQRGAAFEADGRRAEAESLYRETLALPDVPERERFWLRMSLADIALDRAEYGAAAQWLKLADTAAVRVCEPGWLQLRNAWANFHLVQGKLTAAGRELRITLEQCPHSTDHAPILHTLAGIETQAGMLHAAERHQHAALGQWRRTLGDRHPYVTKAWISLSSIQGMRGDWHGAKRSLDAALRIQETPEALSNYAVVLEHLHRRKEAEAIRRRIGTVAVPNALIDFRALGRPNGVQAVTR